MIQRYLTLAGFLIVVTALMWAASQFFAGVWYFDMMKPSWTVPPWVHGPAWAVVLASSALAAWLVWDSGSSKRHGALTWWAIHLLLLLAWSWLFYGLMRSGWAWLEITALAGVVAFTARAFQQVSLAAGLLLLPTILLVGYMWFFNLAVWTINGGLFSRFLGN